MGLRFDRTGLTGWFEQSNRGLSRQDEAIEQGGKACDSLASDDNLTGQAWQAAKDDTTTNLHAALKRQLDANRRLEEANRRVTAMAADMPADYIDEDGLDESIGQLKRAMNQAQDAADNGEPLLSYLTVHFVEGFCNMCQEAIDTLQRYIKALHEFDQQATAIYQQLADDNGNTNGGRANAVMAKDVSEFGSLVNGHQSRKELTAFFEKNFGMSREQAAAMADFTIRFRKYAKQFHLNPNDATDNYVVLLASIGYRGIMWMVAGGTAYNEQQLVAMLGMLGYTDDPKNRKDKHSAQYFIDNLAGMHGADGSTDEDFVHVMGSLACILNPGPGALAYHLAGLEDNRAWDQTGMHDMSAENATWAGDIATAKMGAADADGDMDVINLQRRFAADPKGDRSAIIARYYQELNSGSQADAQRMRAHEFCANYDPQHQGDIARGQQWLRDNATFVSEASAGGAKLGKGIKESDRQHTADEFNHRIADELKGKAPAAKGLDKDAPWG